MASILHTRVIATNDSDVEAFVGLDDQIMEILSLHIVYVSTATVGNRQLRIEIRDTTDTLVNDFRAGATQTASKTQHYLCGRGLEREAAFVDDSIHIALPFGCVLLAGWDIRILDSNAVDVSGDDMTIDIVCRQVENVRGDIIT